MSKLKDLAPASPVVADLTQRYVPPMICPQDQNGCGRGMTPRVERWRPANANGVQVADVECTLCARKFVYTPASIRGK